MKFTAHHFTIDAAPVTAIRIHVAPVCTFADVSFDDFEHTVFRNTEAEARAWLTDLRDKIDAALAATNPDPQQASSDHAAVAAGGATPPVTAAGSADTQTEARDA